MNDHTLFNLDDPNDEPGQISYLYDEETDGLMDIANEMFLIPEAEATSRLLTAGVCKALWMGYDPDAIGACARALAIERLRRDAFVDEFEAAVQKLHQKVCPNNDRVRINAHHLDCVVAASGGPPAGAPDEWRPTKIVMNRLRFRLWYMPLRGGTARGYWINAPEGQEADVPELVVKPSWRLDGPCFVNADGIPV